MRLLALVVFGLLAALNSGCQQDEAVARESFARSKSCPIERVVVKARPDLKASALQRGSAPSPEVAADPIRLAEWKKNDAEDRAKRDALHGDIVEVTGCSETALYDCYRS